jgi:hypothetical protein
MQPVNSGQIIYSDWLVAPEWAAQLYALGIARHLDIYLARSFRFQTFEHPKLSRFWIRDKPVTMTVDISAIIRIGNSAPP